MFQACSQLPAFDRVRLDYWRSGHASKAIVGTLGRGLRLVGHFVMTLDVSADDARQLCRLLDADPLPPEDRTPPRPAGTLEALYHAQAPRLLRFFSKRADRQDAGDLLHETFARFAQADARRTEALRQPEAYLSQVATNVLRNRARAAFLRTTMPLAEPEEVADPLDMTAALEARDMLRRVQSAMMRLSPKTREIFMAHRLDGVSYAEIASRAGLSVKTVEWHMTKAIRHFHRALGSRR